MKKISHIVGPLIVVALACSTNTLAQTNTDDKSVNNWGPWDSMVSPAAGEPESSFQVIEPPFLPPEHKPDIDVEENDVAADTVLRGYGKATVGYKNQKFILKDGNIEFNNDSAQNTSTLGMQFIIGPGGAPEQHDFIAEDLGVTQEYATLKNLQWGALGRPYYKFNGSVYGSPDSTGKLIGSNLNSGTTEELVFPFQTPAEAGEYSGENSYSYNNNSYTESVPTSSANEVPQPSSKRYVEVDLAPVLGPNSDIFVIGYYKTDHRVISESNTTIDGESVDLYYYDSNEYSRGDFLVGYPTDPDIIAGTTGTATYNGHFFNGGSGTGDVQITVQFDDATWEGFFNDTQVSIDASGYLIEGTSDFVSDTISGTIVDERVTSGNVDGLLIGENAQSVIASVEAHSVTHNFIGTAGVNVNYD